MCDKKDTSRYHRTKARSALFLLLFIILLVLVVLVTLVPLARSYAETAVPPAKDAKSELCSVRVSQVGRWRKKSAPLLQKLVDPALRLFKILRVHIILVIRRLAAPLELAKALFD